MLLLLVNGCGLHLKGYNTSYYKFPFKNVYVDCKNVIICDNLKNAIKTQDLSQLSNKIESDTVIIELSQENTKRDPQSYSSVGRISVYLLSYQIIVKVFSDNEFLGTFDVMSQATMQYNDTTILSFDQQEASFWDQLHQNVTNQLIRRLIHFKPLIQEPIIERSKK